MYHMYIICTCTFIWYWKSYNSKGPPNVIPIPFISIWTLSCLQVATEAPIRPGKVNMNIIAGKKKMKFTVPSATRRPPRCSQAEWKM